MNASVWLNHNASRFGQDHDAGYHRLMERHADRAVQRGYACEIDIQRDGTEDGIANQLVSAGIPRDRIALGFRPAEVRPFTEFAVA